MTYEVLGFQTHDTDHGCDAERSADTLADARKQAKYMLSDAYRLASEASDNLAVVQIWKGDTLILSSGDYIFPLEEKPQRGSAPPNRRTIHTMSIESEVAVQLAHKDRVSAVLASTGGEVIHPDHYNIRESIRLAVLRAIDVTTHELGWPKMSDGELPALFRTLDGIAERVFLKGVGL